MQRPKWLIRPGSVKGDQVPIWDERAVRGLSLFDLLTQMQGFQNHTVPYRLCEIELRRREGWIARWALATSIVALLISIVAIALKRN